MQSEKKECPLLKSACERDFSVSILQKGAEHVVYSSSNHQNCNYFTLSQLNVCPLFNREKECPYLNDLRDKNVPHDVLIGVPSGKEIPMNQIIKTGEYSKLMEVELSFDPICNTEKDIHDTKGFGLSHAHDTKGSVVTQATENMSLPVEANFFIDACFDLVNPTTSTFQGYSETDYAHSNVVGMNEAPLSLPDQLSVVGDIEQNLLFEADNIVSDFSENFFETLGVTSSIPGADFGISNTSNELDTDEFLNTKSENFMCLYSEYHEQKNGTVPTDQDGDTNLIVHMIHKDTEKALEEIRKMKYSLCTNCFSNYLNVLNCKQEAALHLACYSKNIAIIEELLKHNIDVTLMDSDSNTAFNIIIQRAQKEADALQLLQPFTKENVLSRYKAAYEIAFGKRNNDGRGAIHMATNKNYKLVISEITRAGANINLQETLAKRTSLVLAAKHSDWSMVEYLVQLGACVNLAPVSNVRAIHYACMQENVDAVIFLITHGVDLNQRTCEGKREKEMTDSEQVKQIISDEMKKRRRIRSKMTERKKGGECTVKCNCGSGQNLDYPQSDR